MNGKKKKIAVLNTHPIQYFAPLYAYLNASGLVEVEAIYLSDVSLRGGHDKGFGQSVRWDIDLLSGYPHRFVKTASTNSPEGKFFDLVAPDLFGMIRGGNYDALWLHGHAYAANLVALAAARSKSIPVMMRCETHLGLPRSSLKTAVRGSTLRLLYSQCERFLAIGSANRAFYKSLGIGDEKIFTVPYSVDNKRFIEGSDAAMQNRAALRAERGVHDDLPIVLYLSKLQRHKRPQDLVEACGMLKRKGVAFHLWIGGTGEMMQELQEMVSALELTNAHFLGFFNQNALPELYAASDVFVLPSTIEPWGLVVNEAMACGLPVVASDAIASADDLVRPGVNGARYKVGDAEGLAAALAPILEDEGLRNRMKAASREIISSWGYEQCLAGVTAAVADL